MFLSFHMCYIGFSLIQMPLMNPYPGLHSVIIMDNCHIHKSEAVHALIEDMHHMLLMCCFCIIDFSCNECIVTLLLAWVETNVDSVACLWVLESSWDESWSD